MNRTELRKMIKEEIQKLTENYIQSTLGVPIANELQTKVGNKFKILDKFIEKQDDYMDELDYKVFKTWDIGAVDNLEDFVKSQRELLKVARKLKDQKLIKIVSSINKIIGVK